MTKWLVKNEARDRKDRTKVRVWPTSSYLDDVRLLFRVCMRDLATFVDG